jgi:hypothetical protein
MLIIITIITTIIPPFLVLSYLLQKGRQNILQNVLRHLRVLGHALTQKIHGGQIPPSFRNVLLGRLLVPVKRLTSSS